MLSFSSIDPSLNLYRPSSPVISPCRPLSTSIPGSYSIGIYPLSLSHLYSFLTPLFLSVTAVFTTSPAWRRCCGVYAGSSSRHWHVVVGMQKLLP